MSAIVTAKDKVLSRGDWFIMGGDAPEMSVLLPPAVASGFTAVAGGTTAVAGGTTAVGGFTGKVLEASIS